MGRDCVVVCGYKNFVLSNFVLEIGFLQMRPLETLYLIDISSFIFRAFFAIRPLTTPSGEPSNAVYGVATMLTRLIEEEKPEYLVVCYDSKEPSFRKELYPEYKANRSAPPEALVPQFSKVEDLVRAIGIHSFRQEGMEADDLIATLARKWCVHPWRAAVIVSGDKDLMQLVNDEGESISVLDMMNNKTYTAPEIIQKFGVKPSQIRDYLALVGDSSDNIPGVPSIGPKSAADLLRDFGTLENVLSAAESGKIPGKKGDAIKAHVADARLSSVLTTVKTDLMIEAEPEALSYQFRVSDACIDMLQLLGFKSLLERWLRKIEKVAPPLSSSLPLSPSSGTLFRTIQTEKAFGELIEALDRVSEFGFDLETTSLNPREAEIVGIAICYDPQFGCYIPLTHRNTANPQLPTAYVLNALKPRLENPKQKKIGQNLKYDCSVLLNQGINLQGIGADTMVAAYVLDAEGRHNLKVLAERYLNYTVLTYEEVCGKGQSEVGFDLIPIDLATRYSAEDAWITLRLWHVLKERLAEERLTRVFAQVDLPLVNILAKMECNGVSIDTAWLEVLSKEFRNEMAIIEQRIQAHTKGPVNLNSPKQLAVLLFDELNLPTQGKTKTGFSTDASVLEQLAPLHEVPRLLLEYREISKLKGTYVDPLPKLIDKKTGKIHASFHQTVTATGRLSSSDPNLQNIPIRSERGQKIRRAFIPSPGCVLISADYSQIELRILAHMSRDPELIRSFQNDEDVHLRTASEIFGCSTEAVDDRQRGIAKAINFGLMYGKTAFGLAQELKISRTEAKDIIDRYFIRYKGVKHYFDTIIAEAHENGYVTTLMGRKRELPDIRSNNQATRNNAERMAMNTPIQGTAADLMKLAMIEIDDELTKENFRTKLIIQVHDEVVLDSPKEEADFIIKLVNKAMENAMALEVPLRVNIAKGDNWMEL